MPDMTTADVQRIYDDFARWWRWMAIPDGLLGMNRLRRRHFAGVTGAVLDVACGTGENFRYLTSADHVTAVDLSPVMASRARRRAEREGMDATITVADAARLPFEDAAFDVTVSAFSSCTFPDHTEAFAEMARVTRPGGEIRLVEHGRSSVGWLARRQDRSRDRRYEASACRVNRDPLAEIQDSGLSVLHHRRSHLGMFHRFVIDVPASPAGRP